MLGAGENNIGGDDADFGFIPSELALPRHAKIGLLEKVLCSLAFFHCDQVHI